MVYISLRVSADSWIGFKVQGLDVSEALDRVRNLVKKRETIYVASRYSVFNPAAATEITVSDHLLRIDESQYVEIEYSEFTGVKPVVTPYDA